MMTPLAFRSKQLLKGYSSRIVHLLLAGLLVGIWSSTAAQTVDARFTPTDAYTIEADFFKLPPGRTIGSTSGLAIHPDGSSIWVFDRCGGNN